MPDRIKGKCENAVALFFFCLMMILTENLGYGETSTTTTITDNPAAMDLLTKALFTRFSNFSSVFSKDITREFGYCIENV